MLSGSAFAFIEFDDALPTIRDRALRIATLPELDEIRRQCAEGSALCLTHPHGIVVIELLPDHEALTLWVRLGVATKRGAFDAAEPGLLAIARDMGAASVSFHSRRRGWARRLPHWTQNADTFKRAADERQTGRDQGNPATGGAG